MENRSWAVTGTGTTAAAAGGLEAPNEGFFKDISSDRGGKVAVSVSVSHQSGAIHRRGITTQQPLLVLRPVAFIAGAANTLTSRVASGVSAVRAAAGRLILSRADNDDDDDDNGNTIGCLLYTSPSPRDKRQSRMPSSA